MNILSSCTALREKISLQMDVALIDKIMHWSIYAAVFLAPLLFAPWTSEILEVNKQAALIILAFAALVCWTLKIIITGTVRFSFHYIHLAVAVLLVLYVISGLFSVSPYGSFWGWPQVVWPSVISIAALCAIYLATSTSFYEKEIKTSFVALGISALIAQTYGLLQIFGLHLLPFSATSTAAFNTVGSMGSLGLFAVAMLFIYLVFAMAAKGWHRWLAIGNISAAMLLLLVINYKFLWVVVLATSVCMAVCWFVRRDIFDGKWMFVPVFFAVLSLFFIIINPQLRWLPVKPIEVSLSHNATMQIAAQVLKKNPLFGSGPGTFNYDFQQYKPEGFYASPLWNVEFSAGSSRFLTDLATVGILGTAAFLAAAGLALWYLAAIMLVFPAAASDSLKPRAKNQLAGLSALSAHLLLAVSLALVAITVGYLFYNANMSLNFIWFFLLAVLASFLAERKNAQLLRLSPLMILIATVAFAALAVFGASVVLVYAQKYSANITYKKAVLSMQSRNLDESVALIRSAVRKNKSLDFYFRQSSFISLATIRQKTAQFQQQGNIGEKEKNTIASFISLAINDANVAIELGKKNAFNWSAKGYVCQNLIGLTPDAFNCSIQSYDKALELYPSNPLFLVQQGNSYVLQATQGQSPSTQKNDLLSKAVDKFQQAIAVRESYALAYLQLAAALQLRGNNSDSSLALEKSIRYSTNDAAMALQIGIFYYQNGQFVSAQQQFKRALAIVPDYPDALYYLGLTYDKTGQRTLAVETFTRLLAPNPQNQNIAKILKNLKEGKAALEGIALQPAVPATPVPEQENP